MGEASPVVDRFAIRALTARKEIAIDRMTYVPLLPACRGPHKTTVPCSPPRGVEDVCTLHLVFRVDTVRGAAEDDFAAVVDGFLEASGRGFTVAELVKFTRD